MKRTLLSHRRRLLFNGGLVEEAVYALASVPLSLPIGPWKPGRLNENCGISSYGKKPHVLTGSCYDVDERSIRIGAPSAMVKTQA